MFRKDILLYGFILFVQEFVLGYEILIKLISVASQVD